MSTTTHTTSDPHTMQRLLDLGTASALHDELAQQPLATLLIGIDPDKARDMLAYMIARDTAYQYIEGHVFMHDDSPLMQSCTAFLGRW